MQTSTTTRFPKSSNGQGRNYSGYKKNYGKQNNRFQQNNDERFNQTDQDGFRLVDNRRHKRNNRFYERKNTNTRITTKVNLTEPKKPVYKEEFPTILKKITKKEIMKEQVPEFANNTYNALAKLEKLEHLKISKNLKKKLPKPQGVWGKKVCHAKHLMKSQAESLRKRQLKCDEKKTKLIEKHKPQFEKLESLYIKSPSYHTKIKHYKNYYYSGSDKEYDSCDDKDNCDELNNDNYSDDGYY